MKAQVSKEALLHYFAGRATALQKQQIDEWAKDGENQEFFFECLAGWESRHIQFNADENEALKRHQIRMANRISVRSAELVQLIGQPARSFTISWFGWLVAATVGAVFLFTGMYFKDYLLYTSYQTTNGETRILKLSDGSQITLNANSLVQIPRFSFGQKTRKVKLTGEADFAVKHLTDDRKFVVQTDKNFEVVVLGTEFMVNTRELGQKVILNKGKVQLRYQEGETTKQLMMKPGNLVTFDRKGHARLRHTTRPQDFTAWKEHRLVFDQTTLAEIGLLFKETYGLHLQFTNDSLATWTVSGAFTATNADELIETITTASNLTYRRQGNTIVIAQAL